MLTNIVIASNDQEEVDILKKFLDSCFKLKDLGQLKYFLGLKLARSNKGILLASKVMLYNFYQTQVI